MFGSLIWQLARVNIVIVLLNLSLLGTGIREGPEWASCIFSPSLVNSPLRISLMIISLKCGSFRK